MTLRETILATADGLEVEIVDVPEWGVKVGVRALSLAEQTNFLQAVRERTGAPQDTFKIDRQKYAPQLIIRTVIDPDTQKPIFEQADAQTIAGMSAKAVSKIVKVASKLAGLGGDEQVEETIADLKQMADDE